MSATSSKHFRGPRDVAFAVQGDPNASQNRLTEADRRRLLVDWNNSGAEYPRDRCIHQLFEDEVARSPGAVAVVAGGRSLSYGELNAWANRLARHLRSLGVTAESRVGLCMRRSPEMVVGILGILKAGGAYVPLDPNDPAERRRLIVEDASVTALITEVGLAEEVRSLEVPTVLMDEDSRVLDCLNDTDLDPESSATSLAYVMYTSGSTGKPKGVLIENRSVVRLVRGCDYATFGADRVFLQLAPLAFDASTFEIWGALLHGARLVQAPDGAPDFAEIGRLIQTQGVTTLWLTAGLFNEIVESCPAILAGVREILTGGESLSPKHVRMAYESLGGSVRIINGYGPTESTTFACCHAIERSELDGASSIPIGRPISNTRAYVLDGQGQPVPEGVAGELYLGGDGLARGYLNRPDETAERFVSGLGFDDRLYRTGDRVRWLADGTLEFLGRFDDQVKLRGFRIELGEIETALASHAAVRQVVVLLREDRPGDPRLVAYLVADGKGGEPDDRQLRAHLAESLPAHMIPSAFVTLPALPLNRNGKVEKNALPAPRATRSAYGSGCYVATRSAVEEKLAPIWQEVLGVAQIGVHDDFFGLGGHSLLGVRLLARIENVLGVKLPLSSLFRAGTIAEMATLIERQTESPDIAAQAPGNTADDRVVTLQPRGSGPPVFMLPGMGAHVIALRDLAILIGDRQRGYGLQPTTHDLNVLPYDSLEELASELVKDIRRVRKSGPYHLLGWSAGGKIAFEIARQLTNAGERVGLLGLLDAYGPGYAKLLPIHIRLIRHFQMINRLEPKDKVRYAVERSLAVLGRFRRLFLTLRHRIHKARAQSSPTDNVGGYSWLEVDRRYRHGPYPGKVDLFAGYKPDWIGSALDDPKMGWGSVVGGEVKLHPIPGGHLEIIKAPWANVVAVEIRKLLDDEQL